MGPDGSDPYNPESLTLAEMDALNHTTRKPLAEIVDYWIRRIYRKAKKEVALPVSKS